MKKIFACMALAGALGVAELPALDLSALALNVKVGFETEYVTHGRKEGQQNVQIAGEVGTDISKGHLYGGLTSVVLLKDDAPPAGVDRMSTTNISPYAGYSYDFSRLLKGDAGYVAHFYTNFSGKNIKKNTNEIYAGVIFDLLFDPSVYAFYDIDRHEFSFIAVGSYVYDLSSFGLNNCSLEGKAKVGYDYSSKPFAISGGVHQESKDYIYFCFEGGFGYRHNDNTTFRGTISYSGNSASAHNWANSIFGGRHKNCVWIGGNVEFNF
jgi:hypothetical protein